MAFATIAGLPPEMGLCTALFLTLLDGLPRFNGYDGIRRDAYDTPGDCEEVVRRPHVSRDDCFAALRT